jgi:GT2 family glycosyltransferase
MGRGILNDVTAVIKTFERPRSLDVLLRSIRRDYPELRIIVADDSYTPCPRDDVQYIRLPPDVGVSEGRNLLLQQVKTPFFLLLDDDLEFIAQTKIERLAELVADDRVDIAAGDYVRCKRRLFFVRHKPQPYHGLFQLQDAHLRLVRGYHRQEDGYFLCDIVHNFFVARTRKIQALGGWDAELHTQEHEEFFLRAKQHGLRVAFCPEVRVWHWNDRPAHYSWFRNRDYGKKAAQKMQILRFTDFLGRTSDYTTRVA